QRSRKEALGDRRDGEAEEAARAHLAVARGIEGGAHLRHGRRDAGVEPFPRLREMDTARRALHERRSEPVLESPQGLAHRGARDAEPMSGAAEATELRDGEEDRDAGEVDEHWLALITIAFTTGRIVRTMQGP